MTSSNPTPVRSRVAFHNVTNLSARSAHVAGTHWVNVYDQGEIIEILTFFFNDAATADRFAAAINSAFEPTRQDPIAELEQDPAFDARMP